MRSFEIPTDVTDTQFVTAWTEGGFQHYMMNSILVVGVSLLLILLCSILAAYALVRFDFRGKYLTVSLILAGFMIPTQVLFIPRFVMLSTMGLINTRLSLVLVYVASALPFSIFLLRQYFIDIPESLAEAARLDGCSDFQILYRIYLPLAIPAVSAVFIFQFVILWNEFLYAFSFISTDALRTLPAGLLNYKGPYGTDWSKLMAGVGISVIPTIIMFIVFRKQFLRSLNMQAKG
jgi:raffinose/stachyose/melibiose transport system permease protein